ncbi:MAG: galactokinase, partial [Thermoleophilia bacterium]|nr:galactokinase [Thermoleophilia bacterium]
PRVSVTSLDVGPSEGLAEVPLRAGVDLASMTPEWGRLIGAVIAELRDAGIEPTGIDGELASAVPVGAGLSSSAAVEVAVAVALLDAAGAQMAPVELAKLCQRAEQRASGVPCGIMDQLASVAGVAGHALLIDCRSLDVTPVAIPDTIELVVVHSGQQRTLAGSAYAERRATCERVCTDLGISYLRDATDAQVANIPAARHVVRENARVLEAADVLPTGDVTRLGELFLASHASLRDDFAVSTPELDTLVEALVDAGATGARLTGAGFGGCVVAVGAVGTLADAAEVALTRYEQRTSLVGRAWPVIADDGARRSLAP